MSESALLKAEIVGAIIRGVDEAETVELYREKFEKLTPEDKEEVRTVLQVYYMAKCLQMAKD